MKKKQMTGQRGQIAEEDRIGGDTMTDKKKKVSAKAINEMEYLMKELGKEWAQSKETAFIHEMDYGVAKKMIRDSGKLIQEIDRESGNPELSFIKAVKLTKKSSVLYRFVGKLIKETKRLEQHYDLDIVDKEFIENESIVIQMDKDEYKMYSLLVKGNKKKSGK